MSFPAEDGSLCSAHTVEGYCPPICEDSHVLSAWCDQLEQTPSLTAISTETDGDISYSELDELSDGLAHTIAEKLAQPLQCVAAVHVQCRDYLPIALLGCAKAGTIYLPLDPALPVHRVNAIIDEAAPSVLLTDSDSPAHGVDHLPLINVATNATSKQHLELRVPNPNDILALLFTSGSTARPKGVPLSHRGVTNEVLGMAQAAGISTGDRALQFASPGFDASVEEILSPLLSGATLVPRPDSISTSFEAFDSFLRHSKITVVNLPTAFWIAWSAWMASQGTTVPASIRCCVIGGEKATAKAVADWIQSGGEHCTLLNAYGPTEASIAATVHKIDLTENDPPIGRPLPGYGAMVVDENDMVVESPGTPGELWIQGVGLSPGYWKRDDLTAKAFCTRRGQRWYRTGDLVTRNSSGQLEYLGRIDDQIKIRGNRIEPAEVIHAIQSFQDVGSAHAGATIIGGNPILAAWVKWNTPPPANWPTLLADHVASQLPKAAVPVRWAEVNEFHLTERGKLDRKRLPAPELSAAASTRDEPTTETEQKLAAIWQSLLNSRPVGRHDSFFHLGGHSLLALQMFAKITAEFGSTLSMGTLLLEPTLMGLSSAIDSATTQSSKEMEAAVIPVKPSGSLTPLFCVHGGDGGVLFYKNLSEHLDDQRPLLAIESPALAINGELPEITIENTAASYIESVRKHQETGPYYLCGYSFGGLVAYEMACQLIAMGEAVAYLALYDSRNPQAATRYYSAAERLQVHWKNHTNGSLLKRSRQTLSRVKAAIDLRREIRYAAELDDTEPFTEDRTLQVRERNGAAYDRYQPPALPVKMILFKTAEIDDKCEVPDDYGWEELVNKLQIVELPGEHLTMFDDENVSDLAQATNQTLANVDQVDSILYS